MEKQSELTVGIIGNPSVGKTRLFEVLTGSRTQIGRTLERREGELVFRGQIIRIVDLPGTYGLSAYSEAEQAAADFIAEEGPDAILQVIDARYLERNLFMSVRLIEMGAPLVIAINLLDLARLKGIDIDVGKLSELLGVPVAAINVKRKAGIDEMLQAVVGREERTGDAGWKLSYGDEIGAEMEKVKQILKRIDGIAPDELDRLSLLFLEGNPAVEKMLEGDGYIAELREAREDSLKHLQEVMGTDLDTALARVRYGFIGGLAEECIGREVPKKDMTITERVDRIALDRRWGMPLFLAVILVVFEAAFLLARPLSAIIESGFAVLERDMVRGLSASGVSSWTVALVAEGLMGGVGNVLVFVPVLGMLFFLLAILEDSGYMARIAFVMDRFMHKLGLHGKAFVPMIIGFGCNVPGVMATRTLESRRDRILAIIMNPFMSCGSRLPTYILFSGIFFPHYAALAVFSLYILGMLMAIAVGFMLRKTVFKELSVPFVIELPAYRLPNLKGVIIHAGEKVWAFIQNAGTIIAAFSILIWLLANLPAGVAYGSADSLAGRLGGLLAPFLTPLGFGRWQAAVALLFGIAGKEIIVGTFGALYGGDNLALSSGLQADFTPLGAYAFLVFVLFYTPCIATLGAVKKETGSWRWTVFVASYTLCIAWIMAFVVYQGGSLLGLS